ncbi:protein of unknown function [Papillibacter cinnamivorans DSM 12816]|uniref:DUF3787 domain-containing protein n=2 Tax=Papillibacter TaxID=100175 RepID=A0A1W1Z2B7_9FIRM|nr:protein of unknown function [Papillibacter cinnamivorans DSM 12816]
MTAHKTPCFSNTRHIRYRRTGLRQKKNSSAGKELNMKKRIPKKNPSAFEMFPLADTEKRDPVTNTTIPSKESVEAAKEWVDFNHK